MTEPATRLLETAHRLGVDAAMLPIGEGSVRLADGASVRMDPEAPDWFFEALVLRACPSTGRSSPPSTRTKRNVVIVSHCARAAVTR